MFCTNSFSSILSFVSQCHIVPRSCIYGLWEAFNDIAEGFGLTIEEYQEIIKSALLIYLNVTEKVLNVDTDNVFKLFDDDEVSRAVSSIKAQRFSFFYLLFVQSSFVPLSKTEQFG